MSPCLYNQIYLCLLFLVQQAMMKDQFANYVVQKVLETCSDQQRELIMSRIKVHLNALKKYTYGKHIVARVEKLVAAGGMQIFNFFEILVMHIAVTFSRFNCFWLTERRIAAAQTQALA